VGVEKGMILAISRQIRSSVLFSVRIILRSQQDVPRKKEKCSGDLVIVSMYGLVYTTVPVIVVWSVLYFNVV
jgi:hypothetical protein